jgi:hypothetical protein
MALYNVEQTCTLYNQCTSHWTDDDGSCWCFESCKANEKGKTFDLEMYRNWLELEPMPISLKRYWEHKQTAEWLKELQYYKDLEEQGRLITLPCKVGDVLYKITHPYRQLPKITKYRVKNFKTIKKGQKLQIEVQADSSPCKSWANFENFYTTREEAEVKLKKLKEGVE